MTEKMTEKNKGGHPPLWKSPEELQEKIDGFFDYCEKEGQHPIVERLCVYLECDKQTVLNYEKKDGFKSVIEGAKLRIAAHVMGRAMDGDINPTIAIWVSKNHYGYKDKSEVENNNVGTMSHDVKLTKELVQETVQELKDDF